MVASSLPWRDDFSIELKGFTLSLTKRARELWLDGDNNPYETLTAELLAEKTARKAHETHGNLELISHAYPSGVYFIEEQDLSSVSPFLEIAAPAHIGDAHVGATYPAEVVGWQLDIEGTLESVLLRKMRIRLEENEVSFLADRSGPTIQFFAQRGLLDSFSEEGRLHLVLGHFEFEPDWNRDDKFHLLGAPPVSQRQIECLNKGCDSGFTSRTVYVAQMNPVTESELGHWVCGRCTLEHKWSNLKS